PPPTDFSDKVRFGPVPSLLGSRIRDAERLDVIAPRLTESPPDEVAKITGCVPREYRLSFFDPNLHPTPCLLFVPPAARILVVFRIKSGHAKCCSPTSRELQHRCFVKIPMTALDVFRVKRNALGCQLPNPPNHFLPIPATNAADLLVIQA